MARKGLFQPDQVADQTIQRNFSKVREAVETLAKDHDVVSSPVTTLVVSGNIPAGAAIVNFVGGASQTVVLPPANALGPNVGALIAFMNTAKMSVEVVPSRGDLINASPSLTIVPDVVCMFVSDGVSKWTGNV